MNKNVREIKLIYLADSAETNQRAMLEAMVEAEDAPSGGFLKVDPWIDFLVNLSQFLDNQVPQKTRSRGTRKRI